MNKRNNLRADGSLMPIFHAGYDPSGLLRRQVFQQSRALSIGVCRFEFMDFCPVTISNTLYLTFFSLRLLTVVQFPLTISMGNLYCFQLSIGFHFNKFIGLKAF